MLGVRCDVDIFKLTASAQAIYREVYAMEQNLHTVWLHAAPPRDRIVFDKNIYYFDFWSSYSDTLILC